MRVQIPKSTSTSAVGAERAREVFRVYIMYYVYLIECQDGTIYTGITTDIKRRFREHRDGKGGAYTSSKKVKKVLYTEKYPDRSSALKREAEIKSWRREQKLTLIK